MNNIPAPKMEEWTFEGAAILTIRAGTNCPQGGDSGHGGATRVELEANNGDFEYSIEGEGYDARLIIKAGGDSEAQALAETLRKAADILDAQLKSNPSPYG